MILSQKHRSHRLLSVGLLLLHRKPIQINRRINRQITSFGENKPKDAFRHPFSPNL
jgi:hypothetical protein